MKYVRIRSTKTIPPLLIKVESFCEKLALYRRGYRAYGLGYFWYKPVNQQPAGQEII